MDKDAIETIVPLLPMQHGFLWHYLKEGDSAGKIQLSCTLEGNLNADLLEQAWIATTRQHQALRSSIHWENLKSAIQLVIKEPRVNWTFSDIRHLEATQQNRKIAHYSDDDLDKPLDITQSPSSRVTVFQTHDNRFELIWTMTHTILDGWSCSIVISDIARHYTSIAQKGVEANYKKLTLNEHTRWLGEQNHEGSLQYWKSCLPTQTPVKSLLGKSATERQTRVQNQTRFQSHRFTLSKSSYANLCADLQSHGISFNSALQGAWALQLYDPDASDWVIFGTTLSGRENDLDAATDRVSMMINLMPIAVEFDDSHTLGSWLGQIRKQFYSSLQHSYIGLHELQSIINYNGRIFDSLIVFENQPTVASTELMKITDFRSGILSNFDLTLVVIPADKLTMELHYRVDQYSEDEINSLATNLLDTLRTMPTLVESKVSSIKKNLIFSTHSTDTAALDTAEISTLQGSTDHVVTQLETSLLEIWREIFKLEDIKLEDDFFDLGGTSLQAVLIFEKIRERLDINLPTTTLFTSSTIIALANVIDQGKAASYWADTVVIQGSGTNPPLFVPVASTDMLMYKNLAYYLGDSQPLYAFRAAETDSDLIGTADRLIHYMQSIQPEGPYHLAGLSGAGMLAWIIAQRLKEQDQEVALLALFDTYGPAYPQLRPPWQRFISMGVFFVKGFSKAALRKFIRQPKAPAHLNSQISGIQVESNMHYLKEYNQRLAEEYRDSSPFVRDINSSKPKTERLINLACLALSRFRYGSFSMRNAFIVFIQGLWLEYNKKQPSNNQIETDAIRFTRERYEKMYSTLKPYSGNIVYFRVNERPPGVIDDPLVGWQTLLENDMTIYEIPGNHNQLLKFPNVSILAKYLKQELVKLNKTSDADNITTK